MRKILLTTILLSIAMSENILENYQKSTIWARDKQFWNEKIKRMPQDVSSKFEGKFLNLHDDYKQLSQILNTRFISEPVKPSSILIIGRPDVTQFSQVDPLPLDKSRLLDNTGRPTILISVGMQKNTNFRDNSQKQCAKKSYHKYSQDWLQQPLYVEEPRYIEIDSSYGARQLENNDPYILTRGKKIFRIQNRRQLNKEAEDYEQLLDQSNRSERFSKGSRIRRFVETDEKPQDNVIDERNNSEKKMNRYYSPQDIEDINKIALMEAKNRNRKFFGVGKISNDIFAKKYEKDEPKNAIAVPSNKRKFAKQNRISLNDIRLGNLVEEEQETQREDTFNNNESSGDETAKIIEKFKDNRSVANTNRENKRLAILNNRKFIEVHKKCEDRETDRRNVGSDTRDPFILSRGKKLLESGVESSSRESTSRSETIGKRWRDSSTVKDRKRYRNEEEARNEETEPEDGDEAETTDTQLMNNADWNDSATRNRPYYREKRDVNDRQRSWLRNIEEIPNKSYLMPRDKHGKIVDLLTVLHPFFIIRDKKTPRESEDNVDHAEAVSLPQRELLRLLLMERARCNKHNYDADRSARSEPRPRDRRGSLENILNLETYDPYYLVRGKKTNLDFQDN